jgi:excisionase family DNA binding protein
MRVETISRDRPASGPEPLPEPPTSGETGTGSGSNLPDYLTVDEVAARMKVGRNLIYDQIKAGAFPPARHLGRRIVIPLRALQAWEDGQQ